MVDPPLAKVKTSADAEGEPSGRVDTAIGAVGKFVVMLVEGPSTTTL